MVRAGGRSGFYLLTLSPINRGRFSFQRDCPAGIRAWFSPVISLAGFYGCEPTLYPARSHIPPRAFWQLSEELPSPSARRRQEYYIKPVLFDNQRLQRLQCVCFHPPAKARGFQQTKAVTVSRCTEAVVCPTSYTIYYHSKPSYLVIVSR
jgi:hypothetical protein